MKTASRNTLAVLALTAALGAAPAAAQTWPSQPIKVIVPFTPCTGMDIIARTVGPRLSERLGQPVVVENRPGASGNIGADFVAKAAPDGHTVMVSANTLLIAANLYKNVPFNPVTDFTPVSLAAWGTLLLATNPQSNINSVKEMLDRAKSQPGKLTYASPGVGTPHHMSMELLKDLTGTYILHIPYKGSAGALTDTLSGQVNLAFIPIHVAMPHVKAGKLKPLGVGAARRHPSAPDLPTLGEAGIKGAEVEMWYAYMAPKGTPAPVVNRLNTELKTILAQAEVKTTFDRQGMDAATSTPAELGTLMQRDFTRWAGIIKKQGITAE